MTKHAMKKIKKAVKTACLALPLSALIFTAAWGAPNFRSFTSGAGGDYPLENVIFSDSEPNVLFYLDVSNRMLMSMRGMRPIAPDRQTETHMDAYTRFPAFSDANLRVRMLEQDTFSLATRPISTPLAGEAAMRAARRDPATHFSTPIALGSEGTGALRRWGRNVDWESGNKVIGNPYHFYSMDHTRPYMLTFRPWVLANWNGIWDGANISTITDPAVIQWINQPGIPQARLDNRRRLFIDHIPGRDSDGNIFRNPDGTLRLKPSVPREIDEFEARFGLPAGQFPISDDLFYLVPNDSRLYAMKLALSRILAPEPENKEFLSRMRIGVATPFDEIALSGDFLSVTTNNFPFRRTDVSNRTNRVVLSNWYRIHGGVDQYWLWHNAGGGAVGGDFQWITVPNESGINPHGSDLPPGATTVANRGQPATRSFRMWRIANTPLTTLSRSVMHIPFDFMFHRVGNEFIPSRSLIQFREKIDGVQQYASTSVVADRVANAEFAISSTRASPESIMFASPDLGPRRAVYADGPAGRVFTTDQTGSGSGVIYSRIRNSEGLMTGTVAGTVLDFFSPIRAARDNRYVLGTGGLPFSAGQANGTGDTRGFFPVTSACQPNWVIYFSTGNESNPGRNITDTNSMMHSLAQIANQSRQMRGRSWCYENQEWFERDFDMDYPIRTIVVGMISTEGIEFDGDPFAPDPVITNANDPNIMTYMARINRNALRRIALAGQLVPDRLPNAVNGRPGPRRLGADGLPILRLYNRNLDYYELAPMFRIQEPVPIFADNVPDLVRQLNDALMNIRTERQASGAPRVEIPADHDPEGNIVIFSASYEVRRHTQWNSNFSRHIIPFGEYESILDWEAGSMMQAAAMAGLREGRVFAVNSGRNESDITVRSLQWLHDNNRLHTLTATPANRSGNFLRWLARYEYVRADGTTVSEGGILGSMERFTPLFFPRTDPHTIFLQTNRGVVHSLCYTDGTENWAFIPPQVFNERLWRNKFVTNALGVKEWIDGDGVRTPSSQPLMLLDGMMHANTDPHNSGDAFLVSALGLAGNGLFMMDIRPNATNEPRFLWSIDNYRYETRSQDSVYAVGRSAALNYERISGWEYLGLTLVAPELRQVGAHVLNPLLGSDSSAPNRLVGIIPGGLGWNMGRDFSITHNAPGTPRSIENYNHGRAFFVFDPIDGSILRKLSQHNGFHGPANWPLGMGVTPVYYIPRDGRQTGRTQFFTGDSEGNILFLNMEAPIDEWALNTIFRVRSPQTGNAIVIPRGFEVVWFNSISSRWLFAGTADIQGIGQEIIEGPNPLLPSVTRQRALRNDEQFIFALNMGTLGRTSNDMPSTSPGPRSFWNPSNPPELQDLANIVYASCCCEFDDNNDVPNLNYLYGWKMRLRDAGIDDVTDSPTGAEFVSAAPHFNPGNGLIYVATFTPFTYDLCAQAGIARLYAFDATTGRNMWGSDVDGGGHSIRFDNVKIKGISSISGSLFLGVSELVHGALEGDDRLSGIFADRTVARIDVPRADGLMHNFPSHMRYFKETIY